MSLHSCWLSATVGCLEKITRQVLSTLPTILFLHCGLSRSLGRIRRLPRRCVPRNDGYWPKTATHIHIQVSKIIHQLHRSIPVFTYTHPPPPTRGPGSTRYNVAGDTPDRSATSATVLLSSLSGALPAARVLSPPSAQRPRSDPSATGPGDPGATPPARRLSGWHVRLSAAKYSG